MPNRPKRLRGFTLVELLVVVAIITVLIALLLPAIGRAKRQAIAVKCGSNIRSLFMVEATYAGEFDGYIPVATSMTSTGSGGGYYAFLIDSIGAPSGGSVNVTYADGSTGSVTVGAYVMGKRYLQGGPPSWQGGGNRNPVRSPGAASILVCPEFPPFTLFDNPANSTGYGFAFQSLSTTPVGVRSYSDRPQMGFVPRVGGFRDASVKGVGQASAGVFHFARLSAAEKAASGIMFADSVTGYPPSGQGNDLCIFGNTSTGTYWPHGQGNVQSFVHLRHSGQTANIGFWDGHVERVNEGTLTQTLGVALYCREDNAYMAYPMPGSNW